MKKLLLCAVVVGAFSSPASGGVEYDRKLEQAAIDIVVGKMGDLRGGFDYDQKPAFIILPDSVTTGSISAAISAPALVAGRSADGGRMDLIPASERMVSRVIGF